MALLPSLPETAHLSDLFSAYPQGVAPLMAFADDVLRGDGALSIGERELIAAYVSGLNACVFCHGSHLAYARLFGVDEGVAEAILDDIDTAPVDERMKGLLRYVRRLNQLPSRLTPADVSAALASGCSEAELFQAIRISGLFNMMNRIVEGTGVNFDYADDPERHPAHGATPEDHAHSYNGFAGRTGKA